MLTYLHKLSSVAMALLVLVSTLSITIEKHYCGDHLVDVAIFSNPDKCGPEALEEDDTIAQMSCCKDVVDVLEGQDELSVEKTSTVKTIQKHFLVALAISFGSTAVAEDTQQHPYTHYKPPLLVEDRQVLHEVYLI